MRRSSRIVILDEHNHILLFNTHLPKLARPVVRWITPGGGVEGEEDHHSAAVRELFEETGLVTDTLTGPIATVSGISLLRNDIEQPTHAEFFTTRTVRFEVDRSHWLDYEHEDIRDVAWFSREEIASNTIDYGPANLLEIFDAAVLVFSDAS